MITHEDLVFFYLCRNKKQKPTSMKKLLVFFMFVLTCSFYKTSYAQHYTFIHSFDPESAYYQGLQNHSGSYYRLDTLYWDYWYDEEHYQGVLHYQYTFSYYPNGKIHQIYWGGGSRYTYEYDEQDRMSSYVYEQHWSDGHWQFYEKYDFTYDDMDRVIVNHCTSWQGAGYPEGHDEYRYEYDDEGHLVSKALYFCDLNKYYDRWQYTYEDDKMVSKCYQRWFTTTDWQNYDLYTYSYDGNRISNVLHQKCNFGSAEWYNYENMVYEYDDSGTTTVITTQTWDDDWKNSSRTTKTHNESGILIRELYQVWQNETWVDKQLGEYTLDESGNCIEGKWKSNVNGEWVDSQGNRTMLVQFNNGESILSDPVINYRAKYSHHIAGSSIDETKEDYYLVYPNPANNILFVETQRAPALSGPTYRINNLMGQTLLQGTINADTQRIHIEKLSAGLYFITIGKVTKKFEVR